MTTSRCEAIRERLRRGEERLGDEAEAHLAGCAGCGAERRAARLLRLGGAGDAAALGAGFEARRRERIRAAAAEDVSPSRSEAVLALVRPALLGAGAATAAALVAWAWILASPPPTTTADELALLTGVGDDATALQSVGEEP